jgi:hypothetical protein
MTTLPAITRLSREHGHALPTCGKALACGKAKGS